MTDLAFRPAVELVAALRRKEVGSLELLEHYLERVERLNPRVNAVVTLDAERAREAARAADEATARGEPGGPLRGLPVTVKDSFETAGLRTAAGAPDLADHVPERDAVAVARLRTAGAVVFAKTNLPTYAMDWQSYNPVFGTTDNPWDPARTPGGSSGGSAAALAAGLTGLELGSDIGGSIRVPSHFCGVFGHKPSFGVVPARGHVPGPPGTLGDTDIGVVGPMGRSAEDLELAVSVLAGPDEARAVAWRLELPPPRATSLAGYRVAAWFDDPAGPLDAAVRERLEAALDALRAAGAKVDDRARPGFDLAESDRLYRSLLNAALSGGLPQPVFDRLVAAAGSDADGLRASQARTMTQRHRDWLEANEARERLRAAWAAFFADHDAVLAPVGPVVAFPHDHTPDQLARTIVVDGEARPYLDQLVWPGLAGVAYLPATAVPVGRDDATGLPVGLQVVGPHLEDRTALDLARRVSEVVGGFEPPPGF